MKNVCMFVWNHFTNDARVLRECTALSENGYHVDLICIHDPTQKNLPKYEERNNNFHIYRVERYPKTLMLLQSTIKNKFLLFFLFLLSLVGLYYFPEFSIPVIVLLLLLLKTNMKQMIVRGAIFLRMLLKGYKRKYDIYHSNDLNTLLQGFICSKLRLSPRPIIYDSHEVQTSRTGYDHAFYKILEKVLVKTVDAMIVENHTRAKYNEELYGFYPYVVHNYPFKQDNNIEKAPLHKMLGIPEEEKILLYQGGIQTGRGLEKLVQAVPLFQEGTLVFIGDGRIKPKLEQMVEDMNLQDRVKFLPKVPVEDLPKYTRNAYLGFQVLNNVCFNHYSASSNKLFEYMMSGVPVVACCFPEIKKVVEGEEIGICVDSHDYKDVARGVNRLLQDKSLWEKYHQNCFISKQRFNWENEKGQLLHVYKAVASKNGGVGLEDYHNKQMEKFLEDMKKLRNETGLINSNVTEQDELQLEQLNEQEQAVNKIKNYTEKWRSSKDKQTMEEKMKYLEVYTRTIVQELEDEILLLRKELFDQLEFSEELLKKMRQDILSREMLERRYRALRNSKLGKLTVKYWEFRNRSGGA